MNKLSFLVVALFFSCQQQKSTETDDTTQDSPSYVITNDTIPKQRTAPKKEAAAIFTKKVPDEFNDWNFTVSAFETKNTFKYLLKMKYKEFETESEIEIPDFGIHPKIEIQQGDKDFSAIVGFLDKEGVFKPYKQVEAEGNQLKLTTIRNYRRGIVQKKQ